MTPLYVHPRALEIIVAGDGQRFTDLIRDWASVYFRRCGAQNFSINGVAWRPDGGIDGILADDRFQDPAGVFAPKTVMQFKSSGTSVARAWAELSAEPRFDEMRIVDFVRDYKLVWFVGRTLADRERLDFEEGLLDALNSLGGGPCAPMVVDMNRLAELISLVPTVALRVSTGSTLFNSSDAALAQHSRLPKFVPGAHYEALREDLVSFFLAPTDCDQIKYISGEPGIGKSRSALEAVESDPRLAGKVCYFDNPAAVGEFFTLARQHGWCGYAIVDEYIGESKSTPAITRSNTPNGFKVLIIGHAYETVRQSPRVTNPRVPLSAEEIKNAVAATYFGLEEFRIRDAVRFSGNNIRLAERFCDYYRRNPTAEGLDASTLGNMLAEELERLPSGWAALKLLALVPYALAEELPEFCRIVGYPLEDLTDACKQVSTRSGLLHSNEHVAYISSPAIAQHALIQLWVENREMARRALAAPGPFAERMLIAVNRLPACPEKEAMLGFFRLPITNLDLQDLLDPATGRRFLTLLTADPETYLPVLHRIVMESRGTLDRVLYDTMHLSRHEIIWRLRDLAQFSEHFEFAEEIVYALAREEVPSAYSNIASRTWPAWFAAYFDHTIFPYEKRLDLLERRAREGDDVDRELVIQALRDPFPEVGNPVPSERVGGRLAPPELNFVHHGQIELALRRIPHLIDVLFGLSTPQFAEKVADLVVKSRFSWLRTGPADGYARLTSHAMFPKLARQRLIAETRRYVELTGDDSVPRDERVRFLHDQHARLLELIDEDDPFITVLEFAEHGMWQADLPGSAAHSKLTEVVERCLEDPHLLQEAIDLLGNPETTGGGPLGRRLGARLSDEQIAQIEACVRRLGLSQFTYAVFSSALVDRPDRRERLMALAVEIGPAQPSVSIPLYRLLGEEAYYREAARMVSSARVPVRLFEGFFLGSAGDPPEPFWSFAAAVAERVAEGDAEATDVLAGIVGELARVGSADDRAYSLGLVVLSAMPASRFGNALAGWTDIATWLGERYPAEVVAIAANREQSEFSGATLALAEIARTDARGVLDALAPKLANPYEAPIMLKGSLLRVFHNVDGTVFGGWLRCQSSQVVSTVAGHLPKPFMQAGRAIVPDLTRKFWEYCTPDLADTFERARRGFGAHTLDTGVYTGFGIDLFEERIRIGEQLLNDPNPGIRAWAGDFAAASRAMLADAVRSRDLHEASRAALGA